MHDDCIKSLKNEKFLNFLIRKLVNLSLVLRTWSNNNRDRYLAPAVNEYRCSSKVIGKKFKNFFTKTYFHEKKSKKHFFKILKYPKNGILTTIFKPD